MKLPKSKICREKRTFECWDGRAPVSKTQIWTKIWSGELGNPFGKLRDGICLRYRARLIPPVRRQSIPRVEALRVENYRALRELELKNLTPHNGFHRSEADFASSAHAVRKDRSCSNCSIARSLEIASSPTTLRLTKRRKGRSSRMNGFVGHDALQRIHSSFSTLHMAMAKSSLERLQKTRSAGASLAIRR
jgi:hypothetical protein